MWRAGTRCRTVAPVSLLSALALVGSTSTAELNFTRVTYSNLGGKGPDTKELHGIRYADVARIGGERVDLMVVVKGNGRAYNPVDVHENGRIGMVGRINVRSGTHVDLLFKFFKPATSMTVEMDEFHFTIYDIDHLTVEAQEKVTVGGFATYCHPYDSEVTFSGITPNMPGQLAMTSGALATGTEDPQSPFTVTPHQERRAATFTFRGVSQFPVRFEIAGPQTEQGRSLLFSGVPIRCPTDDNSDSVHAPATAAPHPSPTVFSPSLHLSQSSDGFDCIKGFTNWETVWSEEKKYWCCAKEGLGCPPRITESPPESTSQRYDCRAVVTTWGYVAWPLKMREWCCAKQGVGCPAGNTIASTIVTTTPPPSISLPTARTIGSASVAASSQASELNMLGSCQEGLFNWEQGWSSEKKTWCCNTEGIGCPMMEPSTSTKPTALMPIEYDCHHELAIAELSWSLSKQIWCCQREGLGCQSSKASDFAQPISAYDDYLPTPTFEVAPKVSIPYTLADIQRGITMSR